MKWKMGCDRRVIMMGWIKKVKFDSATKTVDAIEPPQFRIANCELRIDITVTIHSLPHKLLQSVNFFWNPSTDPG